MKDLKLSSLIIMVFTICLLAGWSRLEHIEKTYQSKLSDLRHLKLIDSVRQAQTIDSLEWTIYERINKL